MLQCSLFEEPLRTCFTLYLGFFEAPLYLFQLAALFLCHYGNIQMDVPTSEKSRRGHQPNCYYNETLCCRNFYFFYCHPRSGTTPIHKAKESELKMLWINYFLLKQSVSVLLSPPLCWGPEIFPVFAVNLWRSCWWSDA